MMRPMMLGGKEILFGEGVIEHLKAIPGKRVTVVIGGNSIKRNGTLDKIQALLDEAGKEHSLIEGINEEPTWTMVTDGAAHMLEFQPDLIVAVGGGSVMDAAKTMWILYEHPSIKTLKEVSTAVPFPKLREKALMCCVPTTSGTASEVSRSVVITDDATGMKLGIGNMEMMPDYALCDPALTLTMPPSVTAATGMDALTHALEAYVSNRANYVSDVLAVAAIKSIVEWLPVAYEDGQNMKAREEMIIASMVAGMSFTNVSLGITHSMAHTLGGYFHLPHGLLNAILLPYVVEANYANPEAKAKYDALAKELGVTDIREMIDELNEKVGIPKTVGALVEDEKKYEELLHDMAVMSKNDGCTKTNPVIPEVEGFEALLMKVYKGE